MLYYLLNCFPFCHIVILINHCFFFPVRYGTLFRNQKLTRKQRLVISSMSVHQFSESEAFMHQLTRIFCNIKVEVTALSSYEDKEELFKEQVD